MRSTTTPGAVRIPTHASHEAISTPPPRLAGAVENNLSFPVRGAIGGILVIALLVPTAVAVPSSVMSVREVVDGLPEDPTCDRNEVTQDSDTYYKHTISEHCTFKVTADCIWLGYTYSYEYIAVNDGSSGWRVVANRETTQGLCVPREIIGN